MGATVSAATLGSSLNQAASGNIALGHKSSGVVFEANHGQENQKSESKLA
jgi:hypothetical protein